MNHPAMEKFSGLANDFTVSPHPLVPLKLASVELNCDMVEPKVTPDTGRTGSFALLEASVNC